MWHIEELMGDYSKDYEFLPVLDGPDGTHNVTVQTGGGTAVMHRKAGSSVY